MRRFDRRALFATGAAAALLAASGVSATPQRGGHLRAALSGASRQDTWAATGGRFLQAAASSVFDGLTELAADGTLRAGLATEWSSDASGRSWSFTLREAQWHDGPALGVEDVVPTLAAFGDVTTQGNTLRLEMREAMPNLPFLLAQPDHLIKPADPARLAAGVGTGLYAVTKFDAGRHFIAHRVETHWKDGQAGWFDRVEFVHFADDTVRQQALREGLVDVADVAELDRLTDPLDFQLLPDAAQTVQIANRRVAVPMQVGRAMPLDNLRMAERWWMA